MPRVLSCRLKSDVFRGILLSKQDQLGSICFCWFPSAMLVPIQVGTSMASPYKSLYIWVKHFFRYLFWQSWQGSLYIYLLSFPRFWTLFVNPREYRQIHTPHHGTRGGEKMEPLLGVFDMLQYFETILPLAESFWSS